MRRPSNRVLVNRCNLYRLDPQQDADAGLVPGSSYATAIATNVACSAQNTTTTRDAGEQGRASTLNEWLVFFSNDYGLKVNDRIDLLAADGAAVAATLYVDGQTDAGGRGAVWEVSAVQRL